MANQTITLKQPHTHNGKCYQAGDTLTVSAAVASWLAEHGVTNTPAGKTKAAKLSTQESK